MILSLKKLSYVERLKQLQLPKLKYRCLRGNMIEVFKIVHNYYDSEAAVKWNFNIILLIQQEEICINCRNLCVTVT